MNRDRMRLAVALLLVASAALFVVGSRIERHGTTAPPSPSASSSVEASPSTEPTGTVSRQSAAPAPTTGGGEGSAAHEAAEHAVPTPTVSAGTTVAEPVKTPIAGVECSASREAAERAGSAPSSERLFGV